MSDQGLKPQLRTKPLSQRSFGTAHNELAKFWLNFRQGLFFWFSKSSLPQFFRTWVQLDSILGGQVLAHLTIVRLKWRFISVVACRALKIASAWFLLYVLYLSLAFWRKKVGHFPELGNFEHSWLFEQGNSKWANLTLFGRFSLYFSSQKHFSENLANYLRVCLSKLRTP